MLLYYIMKLKGQRFLSWGYTMNAAVGTIAFAVPAGKVSAHCPLRVAQERTLYLPCCPWHQLLSTAEWAGHQIKWTFTHSNGLFFSSCTVRCEKPETSNIPTYESILLLFPIFPHSEICLLVLDLSLWVFFHSPEENLEKLIFLTFCSSVSVVIVHMHCSIHFSTLFYYPLCKIGALHSMRSLI